MTGLMREVHAVVVSWMGLDLTEDQISSMLSDPGVKKELEFGVGDTVTRSAMADYLARTILGRSWPTYGEKAETFFNEFEAAAVQKGFRLSGNSRP